LSRQSAVAVLSTPAWKYTEVQAGGFGVPVGTGAPAIVDGKVPWRFDALPKVVAMPAANPPPPTT
jgi:hypothetical protein